jgi:hypothetical protein
MFLSTPISIDGPSVSRETYYLDTSNVLHVYRVSSCDKRTSCLPSRSLHLLLTLWTGRVTFNILPDDVLLLIFHFDRLTYLDGLSTIDRLHPFWRWHRLVHVCRRWRSVVLASPNFLHLELVCNTRTRVELTGIWPPFPIITRNVVGWPKSEDHDFDAAIVHRNRVCEIDLGLSRRQLERLAPVMLEQFPALKHLMLRFDDSFISPVPTLPDGLLGGSAPHLQSLELQSIPFPALPKILLSATHLVRLALWNISDSGYISPEAIVTCLAVSVNLKSLIITFRLEFPPSHLDRESRRPPLPTRTVLPALTQFGFRGFSEDLDDLVARIDAPLLYSLWVDFIREDMCDVPHLARFMKRTTRFQALKEAHASIDYTNVEIKSLPPTPTFDAGLRISCRASAWCTIPRLAQIFTWLFSSIYTVEHLYIYGTVCLSLKLEDERKNMQWLEFFHTFSDLRNLYLAKEFAQSIAAALQELVGESVTDVLPALECIFLEEIQPSGPIQEGIGKFVAARRFSGYPVTVSLWKRGQV